MRNIVTLVFLLISFIAVSQDKGFNYQAVLRGSDGEVLNDRIVSLRVSIIQGSNNADPIFVEEHEVATSNQGVVNIVIGQGEVTQGLFTDIDWSNYETYYRVDLSQNNNGVYVFLGTQKLMFVPYALHAVTVENVNDADADPNNEIQTIDRQGSDITLSNSGGTVSVNDEDADPNNEIQNLELVGNELRISNGNSVVITGTLDLDADPINEIQSLELNGNNLSISDGNEINLDADSLNELQILSLSGDELLISKGNSVVLSDNDSLNELQSLVLIGDSALSISKGNELLLPVNNDNDSLNELQVLSLSNDTLFLSRSNYVVLPPDLDGDTTNEIQRLYIENDSLFLSKSNGMKLSNLWEGDKVKGNGISWVDESIPVEELIKIENLPSKMELYESGKLALYAGSNLVLLSETKDTLFSVNLSGVVDFHEYGDTLFVLELRNSANYYVSKYNVDGHELASMFVTSRQSLGNNTINGFAINSDGNIVIPFDILSDCSNVFSILDKSLDGTGHGTVTIPSNLMTQPCWGGWDDISMSGDTLCFSYQTRDYGRYTAFFYQNQRIQIHTSAGSNKASSFIQGNSIISFTRGDLHVDGDTTYRIGFPNLYNNNYLTCKDRGDLFYAWEANKISRSVSGEYVSYKLFNKVFIDIDQINNYHAPLFVKFNDDMTIDRVSYLNTNAHLSIRAMSSYGDRLYVVLSSSDTFEFDNRTYSDGNYLIRVF